MRLPRANWSVCMYHDVVTQGLTVEQLDLGDAGYVREADAYLAAHGEATPFHRPAWIKAVSRATANRPYMLAARGLDGRLAGLLPLNHVRSRLFGNALVSAAFAVDGGIVANDDAAAAVLAEAAWELALTLDVEVLELRGGPGAPGWHAQDESHIGFVRDLAADADAELARIPRKHRAEVRKALANDDLSVETGMNDALLAEHYAIYAASVRNLGTPVFPAALMRETAKAFGDEAEILVVRDKGRPVAAVFSLYHRGTVLPYWGGGIRDARGLRANELMYFRLMDHARQRGCSRFDFGRSRTGSGQAKWKTSWGFEPQPLRYWKRTKGDVVRDINPESGRYAQQVALWKKLPLPVANLIGPWLSRGLG